MKNKNSIIAIIGLTLFFFTFLRISFAEVKKVEVGIDGLSCPFCVWGLRQQMKGIKAIDELEVSLKKSMVRFILKENSPLSIEEIKDAVKKAGFSVRDVRIEAVGKIIPYGEFQALKVSGSNQAFVLDSLEEIKPGAIALIEGSVHEHEEGKPYGLSIERIELVNE